MLSLDITGLVINAVEINICASIRGGCRSLLKDGRGSKLGIDRGVSMRL